MNLVCVNCGRTISKKELAFDTKFSSNKDVWCVSCKEKEDERNAKNHVGGGLYSKLPRYLIPKEEWQKEEQ